MCQYPINIRYGRICHLKKVSKLDIGLCILSGIKPNGGSYSLRSIKGAIKDAIGFTPYIQCNEDSSGNSQLYQVYLCVNTSASDFIDCSVFPRGRCGSEIQFPSF